MQDVLADAKTHGTFMDSGLQAGYNNGFFIQTDDDKFKLVANGYIQFRYVFSDDTLKNRSAFGSSPPATGTGSEFGFRRARLIFSGNAFDPKLIYMISGDFGGSSGNSGNFQILDLFVGYNFTPQVKIKGGAMLVPFEYQELYSSGVSLPEFSTTGIPFDAVRTLGLSVYGDLIKDKLAYEAQINDGSKANALGRPDDTGAPWIIAWDTTPAWSGPATAAWAKCTANPMSRAPRTLSICWAAPSAMKSRIRNPTRFRMPRRRWRSAASLRITARASWARKR